MKNEMEPYLLSSYISSRSGQGKLCLYLCTVPSSSGAEEDKKRRENLTSDTLSYAREPEPPSTTLWKTQNFNIFHIASHKARHLDT